MTENSKRIRRRLICLAAAIFLLGPVTTARAQTIDAFMKELGFRKSGTRYLYPLLLYKYACSAVEYKPYIVVTDQEVASVAGSDKAHQLAYLQGSDFTWEVVVPVSRDWGHEQPVLHMKGKKMLASGFTTLLSPCMHRTGQGNYPVGEGELRKLTAEALDTWDDLISWYKTAQ